MGSFFNKYYFLIVKIYLPSIIIFFSVSLYAQGEANIWYFGVNAGLNFNTNPPTPLLDLPSGNFSSEGSSTISDANGNLLFYSNGEKVWNKMHQIMLNGDELAGHNSSSQSSAIIPCPGTYNSAENRFDKYFLVTLDDYTANLNAIDDKGVRFSEIDMTLDNGLGAVTLNKNTHLFGTTTTEKVCVVPHSNGCDFWVICKVVDSADFYVYRISTNGFNTTPIISTTSFFVDARPGQMKVAPNNKLLSYVVPPSSIYGGFYVFNFDNSTGLITEKFADTTANENQYGTAFSPDSKVLYKCAGNKIYQYDVTTTTNDDFIASKITFTSATSGLLSMQLAPDGKIYIARPILNSSSNGLGVINNPNILGSDFNYVAEQQSLGGRFSLAGLPNQLNNLIPFNQIIIENEDCTSFQVALENDINIYNYSWGLAYANNPETLISSSTETSPLFNFPNSNENYIITCSIVSECYSKNYELLFSPTNLNYTTPTFNFSTYTYCQNQTPNTLPLSSVEGIVGTWFPNSIDTSIDGIFPYTFTPNQGQCANNVVIDITINANEIISFSDNIICEGEIINFPDTNNISGTWFPVNLSNTISDTYVFTPDAECAISSEWKVTVNQKESVYFADTTICEGEIISFPDTNNVVGTWSPATINNTQNAIYSFTPNGNCVLSTTWELTFVKKLTNLNVSIFNNKNIVVSVDNATDLLLYQLDNGVFQNSNVFENVTNGCHKINVSDLYGCTTLSASIFVFDYPKFFTPNQDGYNDYWKIDIENSTTTLKIFDRYGKFLKQLHQNEAGWDGTYNGQKLPATDYWFVLDYEECGVFKTFKSHFSLKR